MRHFYRSHGKHCYLRSFKSECPRCGKDVLYWECTHGSKVFFEYPPYGKLIRHRCRKRIGKKKKKYENIIKNPNRFYLSSQYQCNACKKVFKTEESLRDHINEMKSHDYYHQIFFEKKKNDMDNLRKTKNDDELKSTRETYKPTFGKFNIKQKNK
ncbi:MAG: hypothetical protein GF317_17840 [Candidatus Lokiarchaeota archaeon]|nr:hypothetical protein [Candidatus Lokiarchaeota archaeon]MBD3201375.1 hypothetical protein [Candidatus Lokiarchaeota archaeon]